jgi:hypothetical protein
MHNTQSVATNNISSTNLPGNSFAKKYEKMRAAQISVTVVKPNTDSKWGFAIVKEANDEQVVKIKTITDQGLLRRSPFREGDILQTVNNKRCLNDDATTEKLARLDEGLPVTLIAEAPDGNSKLVHAMARKPSSGSTIGIGFYNIEHEGSFLLIINHLAPTGLFAYSSLSQGDLVISINGVSCSRMISEEAAEMIENSRTTINILAMRSAALHEELNPSFRQRLARRAMWAGNSVAGWFGNGSGGRNAQEASPEIASASRDEASLGPLPQHSNGIRLTRTESTSTGFGSRTRSTGGHSHVSHEKIAMSMMEDTENMDDTISELSFTDNEHELSAGFSEEITEALSPGMEDVLLA